MRTRVLISLAGVPPLVPALTLTLALAALAYPAAARPEKIRPGVSYYSDESELADGVRDVEGEKNYEEVYQLYTYYEVVYDEQQRVVVFEEYERGEVIVRDRYRYAADGKLAERVVERPGLPPEVTSGGALSGPVPGRCRAGPRRPSAILPGAGANDRCTYRRDSGCQCRCPHPMRLAGGDDRIRGPESGRVDERPRS